MCSAVKAKVLCQDSLLLPSNVSLVSYGIDTTGHWWAITQPFVNLQQLIIDGHNHGTWDSVSAPHFGYDGSTWAAIGKRSGHWFVITENGIIPSDNAIIQVFIPSQSTTLWWCEQVGETYRITDGSRSYITSRRPQQLSADPQGIIIAWLEERNGTSYIVRNGTEIARSTELSLIGVWADGRCLYNVRQGLLYDVMLGQDVLSPSLRNIYSVRINSIASVAAWQATDGIGQVHTYLFTDEYEHPWEGPIVSAPDQQLALSPFDPLVAYRSMWQGSRIVGYNAAFYPGGLSTSPPVFSHDGAIMAYASKDNGDYIVINGKRIQVKAGVPVTDSMAVSPTGNSVAWCSPTTLVVVDVEFNKLTTGKMCDTMGKAVYDRFHQQYRALGVMSGRLYLLTCDAR